MTDKRYPDAPGSRKGSPETSFEAAESIEKIARSREAKAHDLLRTRWPEGCTADEVATHFKWEKYSARPRLSTLKAKGLIAESDGRRKGLAGRKQVVWVAVNKIRGDSDVRQAAS